MDSPVVVCTDGSDLSISAGAAALELIGSDTSVEVVTVIDELDASLVVGLGHAGPVMTGDELEARRSYARQHAEDALEAAVGQLGIPHAARRILEGDPGPTICDHATTISAAAIVIGSRGRGGLKRAVLGSVSDYVVRNAPCPCVITTMSAL